MDPETGSPLDLDALTREIAGVSPDPVVQRLAGLIREWKRDERTAAELAETVERYLGQAWVERPEHHERVHRLWSGFRDAVVAGLGGMTMNERLHGFGLTEAFDACADEAARDRIYRKLHASR